jgi:hypothetical protein
MAWTTCILGSQALVKLTLLWLGPPPESRVLRVTHRYPPTNPNYGLGGPMATDCIYPYFNPYRLNGGSYVLNPVVPVTGTAWTVVKSLYR